MSRVAKRARRLLGTGAAAWRDMVVPYVRAKHKKPLRHQVSDLRKLFRSYKYFPYQYFRLALYLRFEHEEIENFIPAKLVQNARKRVNGTDTLSLDDKIRFSRTMERSGLPATRVLFYSEGRGAFRHPDGSPMTEAEALERIGDTPAVFVKPLSGAGGKGAEVVRFGEQTGRALADIGEKRMLVETLVVQHPEIAKLNESSINTVRIDTFFFEDQVSISGACLRIGRAGKVVDNFSGGGLVVGIDRDTGVLGRIGRQKPSVSTRIFTHHPDSGEAFAGLCLPYWEELVALVTRAAPQQLPIRSIGWDVAITPEGPVIVEANANWEISVTQMVTAIGPSRLGQQALRWHRDVRPGPATPG